MRSWPTLMFIEAIAKHEGEIDTLPSLTDSSRRCWPVRGGRPATRSRAYGDYTKHDPPCRRSLGRWPTRSCQ